jgi:hypothetical protein
MATVDTMCDGCIRPASDVGPLTAHTMRCVRGPVMIHYCAECLAAHERTQSAIASITAHLAPRLARDVSFMLLSVLGAVAAPTTSANLSATPAGEAR